MNIIGELLLFRGPYGTEILSLFSWIVLGAIILLLVNSLYIQPQIEINVAKERLNLKSLSCQALGYWIIDHSTNSSSLENYQYAEARYLVCTHTPSSEMSP